MSTGPLESAAPTTPIIVGGVYNNVAPTPIPGQGLALQTDASGNIMVNIAAGSSSGVQYADGTTQATPTGTVALGKNPSNVLHSLALSAAGNLNVNLAEGTISGGNAAASATGAAVPASADYIGVNIAGNLVGVTGFSLTNSKAAAMAIVDGSGNQITSFGGGTQFADNSASGATPTGTLAMGWDVANSVIRALTVDGGQNLNVDVVGGAVLANQGAKTGTNANSWPVVITDGTNILGGGTAHPLRVDPTGTTTQPVSFSGVVTVQGDSASGAAKAGNPVQIGGVFNTSQPTVATGQTVEAQSTSHGALIVATGTDLFSVTQAGTWNVNASQAGGWTVGVTQSTSPWVDNLTQVAGVSLGATAVVNYGSTPAAVAVPGVNAFVTNTVAVSGTVAISGTPTVDVTDRSARLLGHVTVDNATLAVTQSTNPWVVSLASTTITGTVAVTQSTSPWVENVSQFGGSNVVTGTGVSGAGIPRVTVSSDSFPATQAISATALPLPANAAQETGGNLATIATQQTLTATQTRNDAQMIDILSSILAQMKFLNLNLASCVSNAHVDNDTILLDSFPIN